MRSPTHSTVWRVMACDRASKSNIWSRVCWLLPSAEPVGPVEKVPDVGSNRIFQRREAAIIPGAPQPIDLALGEVLVAVANRYGHLDIFDIRRRSERGIGRQHQILEAARLAGADVEETADRWRRQKPHHHPH